MRLSRKNMLFSINISTSRFILQPDYVQAIKMGALWGLFTFGGLIGIFLFLLLY